MVPRRAEVRFDCAGVAFSRVRRCRVGSLLDRFGTPKVKLFGAFWEPVAAIWGAIWDTFCDQ